MLKQERFKNVPTAAGGNNEMSIPMMWQADKYKLHPRPLLRHSFLHGIELHPRFVLCWRFHTPYTHQEDDDPSYTHKWTAKVSCYNIYTHTQRQYRNLIRHWRLRRGFWLYYAGLYTKKGPKRNLASILPRAVCVAYRRVLNWLVGLMQYLFIYTNLYTQLWTTGKQRYRWSTYFTVHRLHKH